MIIPQSKYVTITILRGMEFAEKTAKDDYYVVYLVLKQFLLWLIYLVWNISG